MRRQRRRSIVVALDGLGIDLVRDAIAARKVPMLAALAGPGGPQGVATRPPASPQAAWMTFATASNPGRHGIFGLTQPGHQLRIRLSTADHVRMPTLWERAATDGLASVVVGLPGTFPARRMSGSLVAGYVVASPARLAYPPALVDDLRAAGYRSDVDVRLATASPDEFAAQLIDSVARRIDIMRVLLDNDRWSLATLAFTELDRWGHGWRRRAAAGDGAARAALGTLLAAIDAFIAELRDAHPGAQLLVLSTHGVAPTERLLNLDAWLAAAGYQTRTEAGALGDDSVAFSLEGGRIYLHAARMFAAGRLGGGSVMPLMDEIERTLVGLRAGDGTAPLRAVLRRRDLYHGPHARVAPHLVAMPTPGWGITGSGRLGVESPAVHLEGAHQHDLGFVLGAPSVGGEGRGSRTSAPPSSGTSDSTPTTSTGHRSPPDRGALRTAAVRSRSVC